MKDQYLRPQSRKRDRPLKRGQIERDIGHGRCTDIRDGGRRRYESLLGSDIPVIAGEVKIVAELVQGYLPFSICCVDWSSCARVRLLLANSTVNANMTISDSTKPTISSTSEKPCWRRTPGNINELGFSIGSSCRRKRRYHHAHRYGSPQKFVAVRVLSARLHWRRSGDKPLPHDRYKVFIRATGGDTSSAT